jgi:hypothetical protein
MKQYAAWCDYSGLVAGQLVGITIMHHPQNRPTAFFTRAYGTFLSNPMLLEPVHLAAGDRLLQRWRILIHEGDAGAFPLAGAYADYRAGAGTR